MNLILTLGRSLVIAVVAFAIGSSPASAQQCTADQIAEAVDQAGASLREIMKQNQPKLESRVKLLQTKNNWSTAEAEVRALELLSDQRTTDLDRTANDLLARIDQLGSMSTRAVPECSRLQELEAASLELQATLKAKSSYMLARADALLSPATPVPRALAVAPPPPKGPVPPVAQPPVKPTAPPPTAWGTTTTVEVVPLPPAPPPSATPPPSAIGPSRDEDGYTIDEIVGASSGFFGKVSAGLGSLVEHAFGSIGRPTGYILGEEGGGAFLAGLRYGSGTLYMRDGRTTPVHWHGPSVGLDFGAQGAKVMFLVYRMREPDQLFTPFTSVEGSAFIAGGLGLTLMTNGSTQLTPIRSGIGLRVGASVGYVRFTRKPTWNPF